MDRSDPIEQLMTNNPPTTVKEKMIDKLETLWYCYIREIPNWLRDLRIFFKTIIQFSPTLWQNYNFDYGYLLSLEYRKLQLMQEYFKTSDIAVEDKQTYKEITLALSLLDIITEKDFLEPTTEIYVNPKTASRFAKKGFVDALLREQEKGGRVYLLMLQELRIQKAWHLYNKLRYERMLGWWN